MKVLHVVNVADEQSIPLELALAIGRSHPGIVVAGFYARSDHPLTGDAAGVVSIGARRAFDWDAIGRLRRLIRKERPDVLHMHHPVSTFWCALISVTIWPRPLLIKTEHNDHRHLPGHQHAINTILYPFLSRIVCNSDTTMASFTWLGKALSGLRRIRIYNGVDIDRVRSEKYAAGFRGTPGLQKTIVIGNIGRLVPQKNQHRLIRGLALARQRSGSDIRLEIVGEGPLRASLEHEAKAAGVTSYVRFVGGLPRNDVYRRLYQWDGFVMASIFEGFCNALVEALAAGLPIASSDIDTLREVAGEEHIRFDPRDPERIADAIILLAGRGRADGSFADRYDIRKAVAQHLKLYRDLTSSASSRTTPNLRPSSAP